jgi:aspartate aminotransferase-like enzyme
MSESPFPRLALFITGPTYVRPEIRAAAQWPEFGHRDAENDRRFAPALGNLLTIAGARADGYEPVIFNGSGSTAMEASIRSLVADNETVLNVSVGAFGDLYHKMAKANGKNAVQLRFENGQAIDQVVLRQALNEHAPAVVTFTHNETSTGVVNDMTRVCKLVRDAGAMALVDGVSALGGTPVPLAESGCAFYAASTQKALALPAGFGIGFVSPEAKAKAETVDNRGHASDILNQLGRAAKNQTLTTPNCALANQLYAQTEHIVNTEGVENRLARHEQMRRQVKEWVASMDGYELLAPSGHRSPTLTCLVAPDGVSVADLKKTVKEQMRRKGYLFDPGYGKINASREEKGLAPLLRIGHMGDITPDMLAGYLQDLGGVLAGL